MGGSTVVNFKWQTSQVSDRLIVLLQSELSARLLHKNE